MNDTIIHYIRSDSPATTKFTGVITLYITEITDIETLVLCMVLTTDRKRNIALVPRDSSDVSLYKC